MYFETWITTDQRKLPETIALHGNVFTQDNMANLIGVVLKNDGANVDIDGSVVGYAIRADKNTVIINGEKEGNRAWVILPEAAYAYPGPLSVVIRVVNGEDKTVIGACSGYVTRSISGSPVDPGHVIPDITELLAMIEECEEAAGDANSAAALANTKAGLADTAANRANDAAAVLEDMDATATTLTPGSSATATVSTVDGHYRVALGIPHGAKGDKGDTGDIGPTPAFSIGTVETLEPSEDATATITGTAAEPVLNLGIPKGDTGEVTQQEFDALDEDVAELKSAIDDINDKTDKYIDTILGKNRLDVSANATGRLNQDTGAVATDNDSQTTNFIPIGTSAVFSCGFSPTSSTNVRCCLYDENKAFISGRASISFTSVNVGGVYRHYFAIQTNGSAKYCRISFGNNVWGNSNLKPQIENGTAPTAYVDYVAPTYELKASSLPSEVFEENSGTQQLKESAMPSGIYADGKIIENVLPDNLAYKADIIPMMAEKTINGYIPKFAPIIGTNIVASVTSETAGKVVHCKKNLFNQDEFLLNTNIQKNESGYYYGMGSYFSNVKNLLTVPYFKPHTNYVISFTAYSSAADMYWKAGFVYDDGSIRYTSATTTTPQRIVYNSTPDTYLAKGYGKSVVGIAFYYSSSGVLYVKDFQIEEAMAVTDFEPFTGEEKPYESGSTNLDFIAYDGTNSVYATTGKVTVNYFAKQKSHRENAVVVCMGDSITGNYPTTTVPDDYPAYIANQTGMYVSNGGFGGCRMSLHTSATQAPFSFCALVDAIVSGDWSSQDTQAASDSNNIYHVYDHILNLKDVDWASVDYLTVFYGTNDWTAQVPIDNPENLKDTSTYIGAFRYGYEKLMGAYPNIKVLAVTPMYRFSTDPAWDSDNQQYGGKYLYDFGDALIDVCKGYHIPCIDMYRMSGVNAYTRANYIADGTHPTEAGIVNLANIIGGKVMAN